MNMWERMLALTLLLLLSPLMLLIAIAIYIFEPGAPIFYSGIRIGRFGHRFVIYKFRSLKVNAEAIVGKALLTDELDLKTPLGKLLRQTKLDELPQLINVVRGEMSFIGPRPVRPIRFYSNLASIEDYKERFTVLPGLSGIAQVEGDYFSSPREKLYWDIHWIRNRSLKLYFWYMTKTIFMVGAKISSRFLFPVRKAVPWVSLLFLLLSNSPK